VVWEPTSHKHDGGVQPDCALNSGNFAVEMHRNEAGHTLYTQVGTVSPNDKTVQWHGAEDSGGGHTPGVALNDANIVVSVHRTNHVLHTDRLYIRVGKVESTKVKWNDDEQYDTGAFPRVALNNSGKVVEVHQAGASETITTKLWIRVGHVDGSKVKFDGQSAHFGDGNKPTVALADDGTIIVAWTRNGRLSQRVGRIKGSSVEWAAPAQEFDDGKAPSLATAGSRCISPKPFCTVCSTQLRSTTDVWDVSKAANRILGEEMTVIPDPNGFKKIINMVYVDYVQYSRVTDVVLFQNGTPFPV
jgi:hypothetical protein